MSHINEWRVSGSYYEVCNCEAVCPCRRQGETQGGRSTYGNCDFALSWKIKDGSADELDLSGRLIVLAGTYNDDEPGAPWRVILYVDEKCDERQHEALSDIFLGRAGGSTLKNFARLITEVYAVRAANIDLNHSTNNEKMEVKGYLTSTTDRSFITDDRVSCGIPGHDKPGQEIITEHFKVNDDKLKWEVHGRCGFATDFDYDSND